MEDRFKFRFWDIQDKKFVYDLQINSRGELCAEDFMTESLVNFEVQQCVGLKDKNGKLIYEGDLIKWTIFNNSVDKIIIKQGIGEVRWLDVHYKIKGCKKNITALIYDCEKEIIGNIYEDENPELLTTK